MATASPAASADHEVVQEIARGSADALAKLYDRHARLIYSIACRIVASPQDAEEVVQDVFAQVWRESPRYRGDRASVEGWLVMMTRARAIDRLRARRARPDRDRAADVTTIGVPDSGATPEVAAVAEAERRRVRAALSGLPAEQRTLIDLAYFAGLSQSEIAATTGAPLGTVKTRMRAAMQTLRAALSS